MSDGSGRGGEEVASSPDSLPDSTDPSGPCPRCDRVSTFTPAGWADVTFRKGGGYAVSREGIYERLASQRASIMECNGCRDRIVVIEDQLVGGVAGGRGGTITWRGFHWWPIPGGAPPSGDVPSNVADAYAEGVRCLSANAPNGAVAMFRTAMTYMVEDKGSAEAKAKGDLKDKVKRMVADGSLPPTLGDWVDHVRLYGNAGVHPDLFGDVSLDEGSDVSRLVASLFDVLYVVPGNIARRQAERRR